MNKDKQKTTDTPLVVLFKILATALLEASAGVAKVRDFDGEELITFSGIGGSNRATRCVAIPILRGHGKPFGGVQTKIKTQVIPGGAPFLILTRLCGIWAQSSISIKQVHQ